MIIPSSPAIIVGDTMYFGGIAPLGSDGMVIAENDIEVQTRAVIHRIEQYLQKERMTLENLAFVQVFLSDIGMYRQMNQIYVECMPQPFPARKVIQTSLTLPGMVVEMTGIAHRTPKRQVVLT